MVKIFFGTKFFFSLRIKKFSFGIKKFFLSRKKKYISFGTKKNFWGVIKNASQKRV
jgi:hypothetical protein